MNKPLLFIIIGVVATVVIVASIVLYLVFGKKKEETVAKDDSIFDTKEYKHLASLAGDLTNKDTAFIVDSIAQLAEIINNIIKINKISKEDKATLEGFYNEIMSDKLLELTEISKIQEKIDEIMEKYSDDKELIETVKSIKNTVYTSTQSYIKQITLLLNSIKANEYISNYKHRELTKELEELTPDKFNDFKKKLMDIIDENQTSADQIKDVKKYAAYIESTTDNLNESLNVTIDTLVQNQAINEAEAQSLRKEIESGNTDVIERIQSLASQTLAKAKETDNQIVKIQEEKKITDKEIDSLTKKYNLSAEDIEELSKLYNLSSEDIAELFEDAALTDEEIESLKDKYKLTDQNISEIKKKSTETIANLDELTTKYNLSADEIKVLQTKANTSANSITNLEKASTILSEDLDNYKNTQASMNSNLIGIMQALTSTIKSKTQRNELDALYKKIIEDGVITSEELKQLQQLMYSENIADDIKEMEDKQTEFTNTINAMTENALTELKGLITKYSSEGMDNNERCTKAKELVEKITKQNTVTDDDLRAITNLTLDADVVLVKNSIEKLRKDYEIKTDSVNQKIKSIINNLHATYLNIPASNAENLTLAEQQEMNKVNGYKDMIEKWNEIKNKSKGSVRQEDYVELQALLTNVINSATAQNVANINKNLSSNISSLSNEITTKTANININVNRNTNDIEVLKTNLDNAVKKLDLIDNIISPTGATAQTMLNSGSSNINTNYKNTLGQLVELGKLVRDSGQTAQNYLIGNAMKKVYPVGSIMIRYDNVNPNTLPGLTDTTWILISSDGNRALVAVGTSSLSNAGKYYNGTINGSGVFTSASTALTTSQIPSHSHSLSGSISSAGSHSHSASTSVNSAGSHTHTVSGSVGSGGSHSHTVSGSVGFDGAHSHTVTGSVGSGGSHTHTVSGSVGSGGEHKHHLTGITHSEGSHTHTVTGTVGEGGSHTHSMVESGSHKHGIYIGVRGNENGSNRWTMANDRGYTYTDYAGAHTHVINSSGSHTHSLKNASAASAGNHAHSFIADTQNAGAHTHSLTNASAASAGSHTHSLTNASAAFAGSHTHSLTNASAASAGSHTHSLTNASARTAGDHTHSASTSITSAGSHTHSFSGSIGTTGSGSGHTHSINLPSQFVAVWKRTK